MTTTGKTRRKPLRPLDDADLHAVAGGMIIYGSTALGGPDTAEASGMIIHGSGPAVDDGAIIFWRSVPSGI